MLYLKVGLTIALIAYLIHSIGWANILRTIANADLNLFLLSCCLIPIFVLLKTWKWHTMVRFAGATEDFSRSLHAILVGLGFGIFTPVRAGELYRVRYYDSLGKTSLASLVILDRVIDLIGIVFLGIYFVIDQFGLFSSFYVLLIGTCMVLAVGNLSKLRNLTLRMETSGRVSDFIRKATACFNILSVKNISLLLGMSLINWVLITVQFYIIMNMYQTLKLKVALASLPIIQLTNLLPITIAGIGVRESLSILVMDIYKVPNQVAAIGAFSLYMVDVLIPGTVGLILFCSAKNG
jgi:uncharacterized protein (TIRG00374 family)